MKKTTLLFGAVLAVSSLKTQAQITITASDMPQAGYIYLNANDYSPSIGPGSAGANQTWNLSGLHNVNMDSTYILTPSSTPYASSFPNSNLATRIYNAGVTTYEYINMGSDSALIQGTVVDGGGVVDYGANNPSTMLLQLPATYQSHWGGSYINIEKYAYSGDSVKSVSLYVNRDTVDGWGSVTTPAGTYPALRVKEIFINKYDSEYYYTSNTGWVLTTVTATNTSETYAWYANGKFQVAALVYDSLGGSPSSALYQLSSVTGVAKIKDNSGAEVYPNPASDMLNIVLNSTTQDGYVKVTDVTGREMETALLKNGKTELNTAGYANGIYVYLITDMNGNLTGKGKFCVSH